MLIYNKVVILFPFDERSYFEQQNCGAHVFTFCMVCLTSHTWNLDSEIPVIYSYKNMLSQTKYIKIMTV